MQKKKQEIMNTRTTTRITRLSTVLLISSVLVLSSIAAAQQLLLVTSNNAAFAKTDNCRLIETEETSEQVCSGGQGHLVDREEGSGKHAVGGGGGHSTCPFESEECSTFSGGGTMSDGESVVGGFGGRVTCNDEVGCSVKGGDSFR